MFNEKNYLAMLSIPLLLSMTLGFSSDLYANTFSLDEIESDEKETSLREASQGIEKNTLHNETQNTRTRPHADKNRSIVHAVESNDYQAFLLATIDTPFADIMTPEAFTILVEKYHSEKGFHPTPYPIV